MNLGDKDVIEIVRKGAKEHVKHSVLVTYNRPESVQQNRICGGRSGGYSERRVAFRGGTGFVMLASAFRESPQIMR